MRSRRRRRRSIGRGAAGRAGPQASAAGGVSGGVAVAAGPIRQSGSTFFERALPFDFGMLREPDVAVALTKLLGNVDVGIEADALDRMVELIGGFPFFLHLYGKHAWQAGDGAVVTTAEVEQAATTAAVDLAHFYGERLRGLGTLAYDWLVAAAHLDDGDHTVGRVAAQLGRTWTSSARPWTRCWVGGSSVTSLAAAGSPSRCLAWRPICSVRRTSPTASRARRSNPMS